MQSEAYPRHARALLLGVNAVELPADETLQAEWAAAEGTPKKTRVFGRGLLAFPGFYAAVREHVLSSSPESNGLAEFVDGFHRSFIDGVVDEADVELGELVWAADFTEALRLRGVRRRERAAERAARSEEDSARELAGLVQAGLE